MEKYEALLAELPKAESKRRYDEELARLRQSIPPPPFSSSPNVESTNFKIPFTTKLACENEIQFAGFGRITFQWHAKSFTSSTWNASLAGIILKHYAQWAKGQSEMVLEGMDSISGLLDRWVQGQGKELRKVVGLTAAEAENLKKVRAAKSAKSRTIQQVRMILNGFEENQMLTFYLISMHRSVISALTVCQLDHAITS